MPNMMQVTNLPQYAIALGTYELGPRHMLSQHFTVAGICWILQVVADEVKGCDLVMGDFFEINRRAQVLACCIWLTMVVIEALEIICLADASLMYRYALRALVPLGLACWHRHASGVAWKH